MASSAATDLAIYTPNTGPRLSLYSWNWVDQAELAQYS